MSKGKKVSAFVAATAVALSMVGYFPAATTHATNASCAANPVVLETSDLSSLATDGKYKLTGDTTGDLSLSNSGWSSPSVEIDLNGCTLNGEITVNGATLTITDSSTEGTGTVTGVVNSAWSMLGNGLVIDGGNFMSSIASWGRVAISGGTFVANDANYVGQHLASNEYGNFGMSDGRRVVEKNLTADDVTAQNIELDEMETVDVKTKVTTTPASKVLSYTYAPISNENFEVSEDGILTAKKAIDSTDLNVTVKQGDNEIATKKISVKINPILEWVRIKDWSNDDDYEPSAISRPYDGHCMGHRVMTAGETFNLSFEFNRDDIEPEVAVELIYNTAAMDSTLPAATIDGMTLTVENISKPYYNYGTGENGPWIRVTATYNGKTVTAHGHLYVGPTIHEIVEGDGAESNSNGLTQKIDADDTKLRSVYICPVNAWDKFIEKYGSDEREWSEEARAEYEKFVEFCNTPVDPSNYEVTHGSTVVTFASAWLNTLEAGEYNVYYEFTDGYAMGTFVIPVPKNEVVIASAEVNSVAVADTGVMTAPVASEGVRSTLSGTIVAAVAAIVAAGAVVFAKRRM